MTGDGQLPRRMLLLDDDAFDRKMWSRLARDQAGLEWVVVGTVADARAELASARFDQVVSDFHLGPSETSERFVRELVALRIPVLVVSGHVHAARAVLRDANVIVGPKPSSLSELGALLAGEPLATSGSG